LSENISVVGPISTRAPQFYDLNDEPADSTWPEGTTKISIEPKSQIQPLFKGFVFVDEETDNIIGMNLKLNEAGDVFTGVYSFSNFSYYQRYEKVRDYWLPVRTEIEARVGITGLKNDFIYRDLWDYNDYQINRMDLGKADIPLSGTLVVDQADSRGKSFWMQTAEKYSNDIDAAELQEIMDRKEKRFLVNFLTTSFRTFFRAPYFLRNSYFTNVSDFYRLNRVEGHYLGIGLRTPAVKDNFTYKASVGYATGADEFRYYTEGLQYIPGTPLGIEGSYYNKLAIQFGDYRYKVGPLNVDEFTYTLQTAFSGLDTRNYFEREGYSAGLRWKFRDEFFLRANYLREDQRFLPVVAPQSLFSNFEVGGRVDPNLNPEVATTPDGPFGSDGLEGFTEGEFAGFEFQFHFDNRQFMRNSLFRDYKVRQFGWFTDHLVYWADPDFGSGAGDSFNFLKYRSSFGLRVPLFTSHFLLGEVFVGGADNPLPAQLQFGSNGFYIEDFLRRRPFFTLGFNEGVGNRISVARVDYDLGSSFFSLLPIGFIRSSGIQLRLYGSAGYRHDNADLRPVTPFTNGAQEHIEVGAAITRILGLFTIEGGVRLRGDAGDKVGLSLFF